MMPVPVLYYYDTAPPVRAVLLTLQNIGLDVELKYVNLKLRENFSPEFIKMNPAKKVPVLKDGDVCITDSHAINAYLVSKYAKNDKLYPKDLGKRAIVDSRLHFDNGSLFPALAGIVRPRIYDGVEGISKEKKDNVMDVLQIVNCLLESNEWIAGEELTIADFSFIATLTSLETVITEVTRFPNINNYLRKCKESIAGYDKANVPGLEKFKMLISQQ